MKRTKHMAKSTEPDGALLTCISTIEASPSAVFGLAVYLDRPAGLPNEPVELREAIHQFFRHRAELSRQRLRELLRRGRTSLIIGVCALGVSSAAGNLVARFVSNHIADILKEGLLIGGWVAMWRPMEIFLYDWLRHQDH
jgi:hypothetical protein